MTDCFDNYVACPVLIFFLPIFPVLLFTPSTSSLHPKLAQALRWAENRRSGPLSKPLKDHSWSWLKARQREREREGGMMSVIATITCSL